MKQLKVKWTGIRPLIMHNGEMADVTNPLTMRIKEITKKGSKKMTTEDHKLRDRLEWEAGLYWDDEVGPFVPADNIERCIQLGAQKSRIGKDVQAAVFVDISENPLVKIEYDGPSDKDGMFADPSFVLRKGVKVQLARIIRVRPMIPTGWNISFALEYDDHIVSRENLFKAMTDAGALVGLGDWRPKFGRFLVE